jgi:alpha-D-ribose 1-methylphosphonate 5-triphosphate synthase subunit PhnI
MGYTAVRGGLDAIEHAEALAEAMPLCSNQPLRLDQIADHLALALARVMAEGGLYDTGLAALAIKQAEGDPLEAAFLVRAYRSTLPRLGYSYAVSGRDLFLLRRISSVFRDIPGGQILGLTRDYTQRLLNFDLAGKEGPALPSPALPSHALRARPPLPMLGEGENAVASVKSASPSPSIGRGGRGVRADDAEDEEFPIVIDFLRDEGLLDAEPPVPVDEEPFDVTRTPAHFPIPRSGWLQVLARGEAGGMLMLAYSSMRGFGGQGHGALAELRSGELPVRITHPLTGRPVTIGRIPVSEAHYISGGHASMQDTQKADYQLGYGIVVGRDERKAISMAIIDASLRFAKPNDSSPVANQEFVVSHVDSVEASGFVEHLKLPHYVTFQSSVQRSRTFRQLVEASSRG